VFKQKRTIPERTLVFAAHFIRRSLDSNGADFTLVEPRTGELLLRGQVYNVMVGHVVLQVLSLHPELHHKDKTIRINVADGPWDRLTVQVWPIEKNSANWPPTMSMTTAHNVTHYGYFRGRFNTKTGHEIVISKLKA